MQEDVIISIKNLSKSYFTGTQNELEVLHGIDLQVNRGEFISIVGESGSGKSTLMGIIGALDRPTRGEYWLNGIDVTSAEDRELSHIRNHEVGFVFQTFNLVGRVSAKKNVELPMIFAGVPLRERARRSDALLNEMGLSERAAHKPGQLSGGQKQRVAIARAMANNPAILLADEPTGALDSATSRNVMDIFHRLHREAGMTVVLITHNEKLAEESERVLTLTDGKITNERRGTLSGLY